jgi:hypothetical protein
MQLGWTNSQSRRDSCRTKSMIESAFAAAVLSIGAMAFSAAPASAQSCPPETPEHPYFQGFFTGYCYESQDACITAQNSENNPCTKFNCIDDEANCPGGVGATALYATYIPYPWL